MKKCLSLFLVFIFLFSSFSLNTFAGEVSEKYNYNGFVCDNGDYLDKVDIVNYKGKETNVTIPSEINGRKVWFVVKYGNIEQLHIPDGVEVLNLSKAKKLKKITVNKTNEKYAVKNRLLVSKDGTIVYDCPGAITKPRIPETVTTIGYDAFSGTAIKKITLPKKVKIIEGWAFENCKKLKTVNFNKKIREIGDGAFKGCTSLKSIVIPNSVKEFIGGVFSGCKNLKSVKLSKHTKSLSGTFIGCKSLKTVKIPNKVEFIWDNTFAGCTSLKKIKIPKSVKKIGENAFKDCDSLKKIYIYNKKCKIYEKFVADNGYAIYGLAIPKHVTIYGYKGSTAQKYAKKNGNEFVVLK